MHTKYGVIWTYDDKVMRDDADADAADQSNTYMSPFLATQKPFQVS